jgi:death-on-curing protein
VIEPHPTDHLTEDDLAALIDAELGGPAAVRDAGLLAAAIARPQATAFGEPAYSTLAEQAAALMHSLVTSHPLVDGNKRIGLAAALLLYALNGVRLEATDDELFDLTMAEADGSLRDVPEIADLLRQWERPLQPGDRL